MANKQASEAQQKLNSMQQNYNSANDKNKELQKELDNALQDAEYTEVHAQKVLNENNK